MRLFLNSLISVMLLITSTAAYTAEKKSVKKSMKTVMSELPHHYNQLTSEDGKIFIRKGKCCYKNPYKRIVYKDGKWYWIEQVGFQHL